LSETLAVIAIFYIGNVRKNLHYHAQMVHFYLILAEYLSGKKEQQLTNQNIKIKKILWLNEED